MSNASDRGPSQNPANNVEAVHLGEAISDPFKGM